MNDIPKDPEEWFTKGDQLPTPEERLKYYQAGLSLPKIFRSYAWRGIGNARQDLGETGKADFAYEKAADAAIAVGEAQSGRGDDKAEIESYPDGIDEGEEEEEEEEEGVKIGMCPKCDALLTDGDIQDIEFRGIHHRHTAYVCGKCGYIIGFSATR
jgi:hypothetical protein